MEIIKNLAPLGVVIALSTKALVTSISISDALIAVSLVGLLCLREHLEKHRKMQDIDVLVSSKLEEMKKTITAQNTVIQAQAEEFDKLRNSITGIKMMYGQKDSTITGKKFG